MKAGSTPRWAPWLRHRQPPNPKPEIRNPKQIRMPRRRNPKRMPFVDTVLWQVSLALLFSSSSLGLCKIEPQLPPADQARAGQALAEKWRDAVPGENAEYKGALRIRSNEGATQTVPIDFRIVLGETNWQAIYETRGTGKSLAQKLVIIHS